MRSNASFVPSVARELPRLDRALQLALDRLRLPADLVVEERAALCGLEEADPTLRGAGERGLLVAEQLALDQRRRHRGAVRADARAPPARQRVVRDHDVAVGRAADRDRVAHQRKREQDISRHEQESLAALDAAAHTGRGCLRGVRGHYEPSLTYAGRFYVQIA